MTENEIMESLYNDICRLKLPPISEKVFQALDAKADQNLQINTKPTRKGIPVRYIFAAILALLVVSVPIIVVMTNQKPVSELTNSPVLPDSSEAVSALVSASESQAISETEAETTLERIKLKQSYGEVALYDKNDEELDQLLVTYSKENKVYEDDRNIYNFDPQGRLLEMRKAAFGDEEGQPVDEQTISSNVNALLKEYYPDWIENGCDIKIEKNEDRRPAWKVYVTQSTDSFTKNILTVTFDKSGLLHGIVLDGSAKNMGIISKAEAVEIVLQELRSGKYKLPEFENKDVVIVVKTKETNEKLYYAVKIDKIPYEIVTGEVYRGWYLFLVDPDTGEFSLIDYST